MTVPGAALPVAGVTAVSVLPSHRRRGVLRSLMRRQLTDLAARGEEPVAVLWASETPIYARYGYGRASTNAYFRFERGDGALAATAPADPALALRLAEPQAATAELAKVYDTVLATQPGFFARTEDWWARVLQDDPDERHGFSPLRCLLAADGSGVRGYALYATVPRWDEATGLPDGSLAVREVMAADPAAGAALWHSLLTWDLVTSVTADLRSADDPVLYQLLDQRRARVRVSDGVWVRIVDLPGALSRRAYSGPVDVVLEVTDELLAGNAGRWRLRAEGAGRQLRADGPAGRPRPRRPRAWRRLPRRHPARHARRGGPGHRAAPRHREPAVRGDDLGPRPVVPADLLGLRVCLGGLRRAQRRFPQGHLPAVATAEDGDLAATRANDGAGDLEVRLRYGHQVFMRRHVPEVYLSPGARCLDDATVRAEFGWRGKQALLRSPPGIGRRNIGSRRDVPDNRRILNPANSRPREAPGTP